MLAGLALPARAFAQPYTPWLPGLQLYTVRDALGRDLEGTLRHIADVGYREVELAGLPGVSAQAMQAALKRYNLIVPSMHAGYDSLRREFASVLEDARILGARFLVCPSVDAGERAMAADWRRVCQTLGRAGRMARDHGLVLAYHNHDFEFAPFNDGTMPFHLMLAETDPGDVKLELDVYWVAKAGRDPLQYLRSGQDRVALMHLKDLGLDGATVELGRGTLEMERIIRAALLAGVEHLFVEQDDSADPMASIGTSYRFLQELPADVRPRSR
jgi:sugar phosphate isomerase/epimerase